jgi:hypothetical protein
LISGEGWAHGEELGRQVGAGTLHTVQLCMCLRHRATGSVI